MPRTKKSDALLAQSEITDNTNMENADDTSEDLTEKTAVSETANIGVQTDSNAEETGNEIKTRPRKTIPRTPARSRTAQRTPPVLTIESGGEVETPEDRDEVIWHDIKNARLTKKILTGKLGGIERIESDKTIAIVYYKELRVVIPLDEMMINIDMQEQRRYNYSDLMTRQSRILGNMLGADIDFIVKGIDQQSRSIVASRKEAMLKKRQTFYMETDRDGIYKIYEGRVIQVRVIAVAEKSIRVDAFGVECSISVRDLKRDWIGDAHDFYNVGDEILIRVTEVSREAVNKITIRGESKSVTNGSDEDNLKKCRIQGKYAGIVTDKREGVVFVRLSIGVNAVAHSCNDKRTLGKKDEVSFAVTHIDERNHVAVGIITKIIKQNL